MIPAYRAGWPSRLVPPRKAGRWWVRIGPYVIGWGWDR